ncbi:Mu transposase C-terminal domain-containing protein [uncultured Parvibaculum sp.]|uniref:Mu transposase C-terminal domain-containing protein n=1 Tax=uncultured Parvibaculum sp. TaxID=291828 RepID=UPI0030D77435|tara:strand:+ start:24759 stop:27023 length:2265 start_codon:yes stop_codon:yes gene_type:complete
MSNSKAIATATDSEAFPLPFRLSGGEIVSIEGDRFEFMKRLPTGRYELRNLNTDEPFVIDSRKLLLLFIERRLRFHGNGEMTAVEISRIDLDLSLLEEKEKDELQRWQAYIRRFREQPWKKTAEALAPLITAVAEEINDPKPPSWTHLVRKIREYEDAGCDARALIPLNRHKGSRGLSRLSPEQDDIIEEAINSAYLTGAKLNKGATVNRVKNLVAIKNIARGPGMTPIPEPHRSTIYRRINQVNKYIEAVARDGRRAADETFKPTYFTPRAKRIGQVYEIDHHRIDTSMIDERTGFLLGRPWLTVVVDRYSRAIVGYYLSFQAPSWHSISMALRHAIAPKPNVRVSTGGTFVSWDAFGIPESIVIDNGRDFTSIALKQACLALSINIEYAPRWRPQYKGQIEGFLGKMTKQLAQKFPNTTRSNPTELGNNQPEVQYAVGLELFNEKFVEWVLCDYNRTINRNMKSNPETRWREGAAMHPPLLPKSMDDLNTLLMYVKKRTLRNDGVQLDHLMYNSNDVARIRAECGGEVSVQVRYDRTNLKEIYITDPTTGKQIPIPSKDPEYTDGLSYDMHRAVWAYATAAAKRQVNATDLARYRDEVTLSHQKAMGDRKMTARRKAAIMLGLTSTGYMPGKVRVSDVESGMKLFDQITAEVETDAIEAEPQESHAPQFPAVQAYSATVVKKPKAPAGKKSKRLQPVGTAQPIDAQEIPPPMSSLLKDERLTFITGLEDGTTGLPMAQLNAPKKRPSEEQES